MTLALIEKQKLEHCGTSSGIFQEAEEEKEEEEKKKKKKKRHESQGYDNEEGLRGRAPVAEKRGWKSEHNTRAKGRSIENNGEDQRTKRRVPSSSMAQTRKFKSIQTQQQ